MRFLFFIVLIYTTSMFSQEDVLAKEYFKNGDFEKALLSYKALYNKTPNNNNYFVALIKSHQQLQQLDESEELLINQLSRITFPALYVELGYNYQLKNNLEQANINYDKAISFIDDNPNYAYSVGKYFENRSLLERAVTTYEKAMLLKPELNFNSQLARIYGEQGNVEKMFESYLNFIEFNDTYVSRIKHAFNEFISEDSENENNLILKKILLKKTQQKPNLLWNEFLSWLFIQQKDYKKAFIQEKAIFNRKPESLDRIDELAHIALNDDAFDIAGDIFKYISETAQVSEIQIDAHDNLLQIAIKTNQDLNSINNQYQNLFDAYGKSLTTLNLQISYAHFLAFHKHEPEEASLILKKSLALPLTNLQEGKVKLELADILVFEEKFNEALIYYSQIQRNLKNSTISQEARFKVARTSYFKGDFTWAESQLKVLKSSTSQLIANDALDLMLLITDNKFEDSTQTALKSYAKADLLSFQNKTDDAIIILEAVITEHKGTAIEDQALYKQGKLFEAKKEYEKAEKNYLNIITNYKEDLLGDDAYFSLAVIYEKYLQRPEKAKEFYEQILFNYEDSIYFVESRKKYRMLRGDAIN